MSRQGGVAIENNFTKGLITETTALKFPPNACTETYNCVFDSTGRVTRRLGIDLEPSFTLGSITTQTDEVYTEYQWYAVAGNGLLTFLVQQQGDTIRFYDVSTEGSVSAQLKSFTIDLDDLLPEDSTRNPAIYPCSFAQGKGKLVVVNEATDPFFVSYNLEDDTITTTRINLKFRDFEGLDDGLEDTERPTSDIATLKTNNPEHYYNLLNQGWTQATGSALTDWDADRTDLPSNADYIGLYRESETDIYSSLKVADNSPGSGLAPKGHFILEVGNISRTGAMNDEGFTGATVDLNRAAIGGATGTVLNGGGWINTDRAFDDDVTEDGGNCSTNGSGGNNRYLGKTFSTPFAITKAVVYGSDNLGFLEFTNPSLTIYLYAKNGVAPVAYNDGTLLGSVTFTDTSNESAGREILSNDTDTTWTHVWTVITNNSGDFTSSIYFAEVIFYASDPSAVSFFRPSCTAFFAGRVWYSGIKADGINGNIYFSQIIERDNQYGRCFQLNDPSNEHNAQLLPTDGGVVSIPEAGNIVKLFPTQNSMLVLATNGVWLIGGSQGGGFDATAYVVSRLSNIGTNNGLSVIDINGLPFWWAESDIYTAQYDPNYNSYKVVPITTDTIQSFIGDIPEDSRVEIKGTFNLDSGLAAWVFNDGTLTTPFTYNRALILDTVSGAFYPWTISSGPSVRGVVTVTVGDGSTVPRTFLPVTYNSSGDKLTYASPYKTTYLDWESVDSEDYTSYFVTGYRIDGQAHRFFQSNYVWVYLDTETNASCYMRGQFDFANSGSSGKWSTSQQIYNSSLTYRDVNHRRLKVRGKGKSLQLRFESETGKPFTIIGWVIWETSNASV